MASSPQDYGKLPTELWQLCFQFPTRLWQFPTRLWRIRNLTPHKIMAFCKALKDKQLVVYNFPEYPTRLWQYLLTKYLQLK